MAARLEKFRLFNRINNKTGLRTLVSFILIAAVALTLLVSLRNTAGREAKNALISANENLKLAQSRLSQNNIKEARALLQAALLDVSGLPAKKSEKVKNEINQILTGLDRISQKQPVLFLDFSGQVKDIQPILLTAFDDNLNMAASSGVLFSAVSDGLAEMGKFGINPKFIFGAKTAVAALNESGKFAVFDLKSKSAIPYALKDPVPALDAVLYEDNLYILSENRIYKYADALSGGVKRDEWANDSSGGRLIALAVDGNIFVLNEEGRLIKYFKGKKLTEFDLQLSPSAASRIFTAKDSAFLYLADKINKKVYVFDKSGGELKASYDLSLAGQIQDIFVTPSGTIWALSTDNKIWQIQP
jgi:hypothetical protein